MVIKSFEGGRGAAAILVALFHLGVGAGYFSAIRNGYLFVDLFFVLSGFVICASYSLKLENMDSFRPFLLRRFGRLFPLMIFSTAIFVLVRNHQTFAEVGYSIPSKMEILSTLTLTQGMGVFDKLFLNYVSWSISTEFYTYLLFASICFFLRGRVRLLAFALITIVGFLITAWATIDVHKCLLKGKCLDISYDFGFARCAASFFLGALTYSFSRTIPFKPTVLQISGLTVLSALFFWTDKYPLLTFLFPLVFSVLVLSVSKDIGLLSVILKSSPFQLLGKRSYSIYMMHPILLFYMQSVITPLLTTLVYIAVLVFIADLTYRFIEDPFRKMFNRIADRTLLGVR